MNKNQHPLNMLLITTFWQDYETFKLMPISSNCPFIEVIYERHTEMLIVLNKHFKDNFHMVPKLNDNGDAEPLKPGSQPRRNGKPFKEKREKLQTYQDYFMINKEEQVAFIKMMAANAEEFDYEKFMTPPPQQGAPGSDNGIIMPEKPGLVDANGQPMKAAPKPKPTPKPKQKKKPAKK
jgi:hypothetical protein